MWRAYARRGVLLALLASRLAAQAPVPDQSQLNVVTQSPQPAIAGETFRLPLVVTGGFAPYSGQRISGDLPPGLKLHPHSGTISGVPTTPGEYHFTIAVTDSSIPHLQAQRDLVIKVIAGLTIDWKQDPKVQGTTLSGSVVVSNQTEHPFDLTVIVVAVNSIGRATALGYQQFKLPPKSDQVIPFGSSPGPGSYTIHADAVGHWTGNHHIYRARKQTSNTLQVTQL
jgi:putative Ig domain-containing protein